MLSNEDGRLAELFSDAELVINYEFLEKAITYQSVMEGVIKPNQFMKIVSLSVDNDERRVDFNCNVFNFLEN
jgi:hypothetical protein